MQAQQIGKNAQDFVRINLMPKNIYCYYGKLFEVTILLVLWPIVYSIFAEQFSASVDYWKISKI